jgi:hypothetical protein
VIKNNPTYKARRALVIGVTGTGKTTLIAKFIHTHPAELVLIYEWQGTEFRSLVGGTVARSRNELKDAIDHGDRIICYDAEQGEEDPRGEGFDWFCGMVFEVAGKLEGRLLFVVDESQDLIDPYNLPENFGDVLSRGRRREIDTVVAGRSANALQTESRDQVSEFYCFRLLDENSLKYPKAAGLDVDQVKDLRDGEFFYRNMTTGEQHKLDLFKKKSISRET